VRSNGPTNTKPHTIYHQITIFLVIIAIITTFFSNSDEIDNTAEKMSDIQQLCENNINWTKMGPSYSNLNECINRSIKIIQLMTLNGYNARAVEGCDSNGSFIHAWVMIKINGAWYDFEPYSLRFSDNSHYSEVTVYNVQQTRN